MLWPRLPRFRQVGGFHIRRHKDEDSPPPKPAASAGLGHRGRRSAWKTLARPPSWQPRQVVRCESLQPNWHPEMGKRAVDPEEAGHDGWVLVAYQYFCRT